MGRAGCSLSFIWKPMGRALHGGVLNNPYYHWPTFKESHIQILIYLLIYILKILASLFLLLLHFVFFFFNLSF